MPTDTALLTLGLAFFVPLGYALISAAARPTGRARHAALVTLAALGAAVIGYAVTGFALHYGGVGLAYDRPGLEGLIWEWSALGPAFGPGWGMAGLAGWLLNGPATTGVAQTLVLAALPWVTTAALIPMVALGGRIPTWTAAAIGLLTGAAVFPLAGNWVWGGGWLANLGANLGLGHGLVDAAGGGTVHLLGAGVTLAAILLFLPRRDRSASSSTEVPLPEAPAPLLAGLGAVLLLAGSLAWTLNNPLLPRDAVSSARIALNFILAAAGGAALPVAYTWLVAGKPDALMGARGLAAAVAACAAAGPFLLPWSALSLGAVVGLLIPFAVYFVDRVMRWDDVGAALAVHGLGGGLGLVAVGLLADGSAGSGWNGIGTGQGVTGLLAATGSVAGATGQMQAQVIGLAALLLFGFFAAWLVLTLPALAYRWVQANPPVTMPKVDGQPLPQAPVPLEIAPQPEEVALASAVDASSPLEA